MNEQRILTGQFKRAGAHALALFDRLDPDRPEVVSKSVVDGEHLVEVQIRNENQSGLATALGSAIVSLPSRR